MPPENVIDCDNCAPSQGNIFNTDPFKAFLREQIFKIAKNPPQSRDLSDNQKCNRLH